MNSILPFAACLLLCAALPVRAQVAVGDVATTPAGKPVTIAILANDTGGTGTLNTSSVATYKAPAHGTVSLNLDGTMTYTPAPGFSGTDTFQYTVADLAPRSAPATVTVTVLPATGGCPQGSAYVDGCAGAPSGTPQMPALLSAYPTKPAWNVAGVDYYTGVPSGTALADPATASLPAGATYDGTNHTLTLAAPGGTITGLDFSLHGGIEVKRTAGPWTVQNSRFRVSTNGGSGGACASGSFCGTVLLGTGTGDLTLLNNEIDGNSVAVTAQQGATISWSAAGKLTMRYNYIHHTGGDMFDCTGGGPADYVIQSNLINIVGVNTPHADAFQWYNCSVSSVLQEFNTLFFNTTSTSFLGNGGLTIVDGGSGTALHNGMMRNNVVLQPAGYGNFVLGIEDDVNGTASNLVMHENWIDPTASLNYTGAWLFPNNYYKAYFGTGSAISHNINIKTNSVLTFADNKAPYTVVPDPNGVTPATSDVYSVVANPASGNVASGGTVSFTLALTDKYTATGSSLSLSNGKTAAYTSGSGSNRLVYTYTVGTETGTGIHITAVNGTLKDPVGNPLNAAGALVNFAGLTTNVGGIIVPAPSSGYADGASAAPAGTPQFPNALAGYSKRPPWAVAGVDYAVGAPAGTVYKNVSTLSLAGASVDNASHMVRISGDNVVFDGYDMTLNGGYGIYVSGSNATVKNCNFAIGANQLVPINIAAGAVGFTARYNTFDGKAGGGNIYAMLNTSGSGPYIVEYNAFTNVPADAVDFSAGPFTPTLRYNLFYNLGTAAGTHPDPMQYVATATNIVEAFNTVWQPNLSGEEAIQIGAKSNGVLIENNTLLAKGPGIDMSYVITVVQKTGDAVNNVVVGNNFLDTTGSYGPYYPPSGTKLTFAGDTNMATGAAFGKPAGVLTSDVSTATATPASGTQGNGSTITFTLTMDQPYTVAGTPTLTLNNGASATYTSGSGTAALGFRYTIGAGQTVGTLAITGLSLPGGATIKDQFGNAANMAGANVTFSGLGVSS